MRTEEVQPLLQGNPVATAAEDGRTTPALKDRNGATLKGLVITTVTALAVYLLAATASRTILVQDSALVAKSSLAEDGDSLDASTQASGSSQLGGGLIPPMTHSIPHKPALTTTEDCTGDKGLPVLAGFDLVAYWSLPEDALPVLGSPTLMSVYSGYRFFFSSIENLQEFESDPLKYIPAWGGFCSYGISDESVWTADNLGPFGDPHEWVIKGGKLHVFRSNNPKLQWCKAVEDNIEAGDAFWNGLFPPEEGPGPLNTACFCSEELCFDY